MTYFFGLFMRWNTVRVHESGMQIIAIVITLVCFRVTSRSDQNSVSQAITVTALSHLLAYQTFMAS